MQDYFTLMIVNIIIYALISIATGDAHWLLNISQDWDTIQKVVAVMALFAENILIYSAIEYIKR